MPESADITVVTSTYNAGEHVHHAIAAMREVLIAGVEWIVVDGASTDGTLDILEASRDVVTTLIQGPDLGIFDAWNKALAVAKGKWIMFLGADDKLAPGWLDVVRAADPVFDLVYGDLTLIGKSGFSKTLRYAEPQMALLRLPRAMPFPHPGLAHSRRLFRNCRFDADLRVIGDWEFLLRARPRSVCKVQHTQAVHRLGGVSSSVAGLKRQREEIDRLVQFGLVKECVSQRLKWSAKMQAAQSPKLFGLLQDVHLRYFRR